jgi:sugar phosphate isomerase/epimerase
MNPERKWSGAAMRLALLATALAMALGATGEVARAQQGPAHGYTMTLLALAGPQGADLTIDVDAPPGAAAVDLFDRVKVTVETGERPTEDVLVNLKDVAAVDGVATVQLGDLQRDRVLKAQVLVRDKRIVVLQGQTRTKLRPDLVVRRVLAPPQTTTSRAIDVVADLEELNGDVGATATATLMLGPTPLAEPKQVSVAAAGKVSVTFTDVTVPTPVVSKLEVVLAKAAPAETDATNNGGSTTIDVSEHELLRTDVLVPSLGGYGVQFNQHVYAPITNLPATAFEDLETGVKELEPQLVRIFYNENFEEPGNMRYDPGNIESFRRTVALAQAAGATINITYHTVADARTSPVPHMRRFADALADLRARGNTNVVWATVGNEPNGPAALTLAQWETLYRALDAELRARGLRDEIKLMGGDLIESSGDRDHAIWFEHMTTHMTDILDAYSEHVYWWYDTFNLEGARRFEFRLRDIRKLVVDDAPPEARRPPYIMEFGVRGLNAVAGKPTVTNFAYYEDGTFLRETNVAAFQQLWFNIAAAQLGFVGTSKWDLYWGTYDFTNPPNQSYWTMEPLPDGSWRVFPTYHALKLLLATTERGWQGVRVLPWRQDDWDPTLRDQPEKELAAYVGGDELTLLGLDTRGRLLNAASPERATYSIGGLPPSAKLNLAIWNADGDGRTAAATELTTSAAGVARFEAPLQSAFALTTVDVD